MRSCAFSINFIILRTLILILFLAPSLEQESFAVPPGGGDSGEEVRERGHKIPNRISNRIIDRVKRKALFKRLFSAIQRGDLEKVKFIVSDESFPLARINERDSFGNTPLIQAARFNHQDVLHFLLKSGAQAGLTNDDGEDAFLVACKAGHLEIVKSLHTEVPRHLERILANNHIADLRLLASCGVNLNAWVFGDTPFLVAAVHDRRKELIRVLLENGVNVNAYRMNGDQNLKNIATPLMYAAKWGDLEVITLLLEYGASVSHPTKKNIKAVNWAKNAKVAELLTPEVALRLRTQKYEQVLLESMGQAIPQDVLSIISLYSQNPVEVFERLKLKVDKVDDVEKGIHRNSEDLYALAKMYEEGIGTEKNPKLAAEFFGAISRVGSE